MLLYPLLLLATTVFAQSSSSSTATAPGSSSSAAPSETSYVPAPTATPLESTSDTTTIGGAGALPPTQPWCPSSIFCAGPLLQALDLAQPYSDSKTIVDKPTNKSSFAVLDDFQTILSNAGGNLTNITVGAIVQFLENDFRGEGLELEGASLPGFQNSPPFLDNITNPLIKAFAQTVHDVWPQLIRTNNASVLCAEGNSTTCESSLIPLNHTFVVPGGRFREQYYWDSFWILEGLFQSQLFEIAKNTLQNFMDEIEHIGFIPNGGRIYYLDRSQPPLFNRMLFNYVIATGDKSILNRALPLAEKELLWWKTNRSLNVKSRYTGKTHQVYHYDVKNTAPRPESYLEDFLTTNGPDLPENFYNETQREDLWAELATGAESGWDYSSRFIKQPTLNLTNNFPALRTLNIRHHIPVDLNSILYNAHASLSILYGMAGSSNGAVIASHQAAAANLKAAILDLNWCPKTLAFYDYNLTSNARNTLFSVANYYPPWAGIIPDEILSSENNAQAYFGAVNMVLSRYNGTFPATFVQTGLQWDAPNAWPPHAYIIMQALLAMPNNISSGPLPSNPNGSFAALPVGQLGLNETDLPVQTIDGGGNATNVGKAADISVLNGTWVNGGNATTGEGWRDAIARGFANRYVSSALCSFQASGGSIPGLLPSLPPDQRIQGAQNLTGLLFEKFSVLDVDSGGRGGEYTVQAGFGWTNGVLLWTTSRFGKVLASPTCPTLHNGTNGPPTPSSSSSSSSASKTPGAAIRSATPVNTLTGVSVLVFSVLGVLAVL